MTEVRDIAGHSCIVVGDEDGTIATPQDALDYFGDAMGEGARLLVVPVAKLDPEFFRLRSGLAGEVLQKAVNYGIRLAIVGDISAYVAASDAFRDLVVECDRGRDVFFAPDVAALEERLVAVPA